MINIFKKISVLFILFLVISGCVKEDFDIVPEKEYTVDFEANTSIAELKEWYRGGNVLIDQNIIIKGIVTANDETGNFYKELYIQDETGALNIRLNINNLYLQYPIGQMVYVKCSGLYLGTFNDVYQIGYGSNVDRIESVFVDDFLYRSNEGTPVIPKVVRIDELNDEDLGMLIQIDNVQFVNPNQTFADAENLSDRTTVIEDCNGNKLDVRNSGYANFAGDNLPEGNGSIIGIHGKWFNYQMKIRSPQELSLTGDRCSK